MGTYVGKWDCPICGTKRIPGWKNGRTVEICPSCGGPCTGKWYLDNREMEIHDPKEVQDATKKRAWTCGHCSHVNDADDTECDACGNARDVETGDTQFVAREYSPDDVPFANDDVEGPEIEKLTDTPEKKRKAITVSGRERLRAHEAAMAERKLKRRKIFLAIGAGLALLTFLLLWKKEIPVQIEGFSWERETDIENFGPVSESSWDYPPSGAYSISSREEVHHYNSVFDHTECHNESYSYVCGTTDNGNGTFSDTYCSDSRQVCNDVYRDEPVYATRYYYTIDKWHFDHTEELKGNDHLPIWPTYSKVASSPGTWRDGARRGVYRLHLVTPKRKQIRQKVPEERWMALEQGGELRGYQNRVFGYWMGLKD